MALYLARRGHRVLATGRDPALLQGLEEEARAQALPIAVSPMDVNDGEAVQATISRAVQELGHLDALVNNAGYILSGCLEELTLEEVRAVIETNVLGVLRVSQAVLPHMRERGSGTIVNVGSVAGLIGTPTGGAYAITKFALEGLSRVMRMEVAQFGVRVVLIEPGLFRSDLHRNQVVGSRVLQPGSPYLASSQRGREKSHGWERLARDPLRVAARVNQIIQARQPKARYTVGIEALAGAAASRLLPDGILDFFVKRVTAG